MLLRSYLLLTVLLATAGCANVPWKPASGQSLANDPLLAPTSDHEAQAVTLVKGMNFERSGQLDKAREAYEKVRKEEPHQVEPLHRLAVVADKQRRHQHAQSLYLEAIQIEPRNAELFNDLGYSFYLDGQLAKAESALAKATQLDPQSARFRNNLGMVIGRQGRMQEAFEQFAQAGSQADAHYNVAFLYSCQNKVEDAKLCFQRALLQDPAHEKARKALDSFQHFERNGGLTEEEYTADGRRWILYQETADGQPNLDAMADFGISRHVDSVLPGAHQVAQKSATGT
jgi:Flp pilus assembly protein TadD